MKNLNVENNQQLKEEIQKKISTVEKQIKDLQIHKFAYFVKSNTFSIVLLGVSLVSGGYIGGEFGNGLVGVAFGSVYFAATYFGIYKNQIYKKDQRLDQQKMKKQTTEKKKELKDLKSKLINL